MTCKKIGSIDAPTIEKALIYADSGVFKWSEKYHVTGVRFNHSFRRGLTFDVLGKKKVEKLRRRKG